MTHETLHGRQRQLLSLLRAQQQVVTSKELAAVLEVSDRTVRNDVRTLNAVLEQYGSKIETVRGKGLYLRTQDGNAPMVDHLVHSVNMLQTRDERMDFLLLKLLLSDKELHLGELEDELFVSRTTLESDIRFVRKAITNRRPHLVLNRGGNRISIEAPEWRKRLMLTKIFAERWDYHSREGVQLRDSPLDSETFRFIFDRTKALIREHRLKMDDYDLIALVFTIAVAEFRIHTGHPLDEPVEDREELAGAAPLVNRLLNEVEALTRTAFGPDERRSIMLSLAFRLAPEEWEESPQEALRKLDKNALRCTELFLNSILEQYKVDLTGDEQLFADLARHISRLEQRLRYSYERKNTILSTIKTRYIFFFELAMTIKDCFPVVYGMELGEDEWGYFADCLITAAARIAKGHYPNGIPVAFVSHLGRSDREMLTSQLRAIYGNTIDLRGPFSIYEKEKIRNASPELILSTVRLETVRTEITHLPHMTISSMLSESMYTRLNWHIQTIHERLLFKPLPQEPADYFDPRLFFSDLDCCSDVEVISFLTRKLVELGYATIECIARALEREEASSTAMDNGIALPRLRVLGPFRSVVAVALLRKPIHWGGQKVSIVFFLSVSEEDLPTFGTLLNYLANDLFRRGNKKKLLQIQTYEDLLELL